jgi:hypothetical protein
MLLREAFHTLQFDGKHSFDQHIGKIIPDRMILIFNRERSLRNRPNMAQPELKE